MSVHFDIGRITLHGYSPGQGERFAAALRTRLAGMSAAEAGASQRIDRLDAGILSAGATPEQAAAQIAAAILAAAGHQRGARDA